MVWGIGPQQQMRLDPDASGIGGLKVGIRQTLEPQGRYDPYQRPQLGQRFQPQRMFEPDSTGWLGRFRPIANKDNDYLIDRDLQRTLEADPSQPIAGTYTGLPNPAQDPMAQETMGAIYDRTQEHLATSDNMIIRARRRLINAAKAYRDQGAIPPGVDNPELFRMRSGGALLPKGVNGLEMLKEVHFMRADNIEVEVEVPASGS
jgi:hypothetical protein